MLDTYFEETPNFDITNEVIVPKKVFIVPYRNRTQHKFFFSKYMSFILEDEDDYEIYFSHQCDSRTFNRGAIKNIGFLAMKKKYPNNYKDITFIFNDVDTIPFNKIFDYETTPGVVKHFYGFKYALGGIVVIKGSDFELINGYPCFWGWGMEDNVLQKRCERNGIVIDRNVFYNIGSPEILQLFDGVSRIISKKDPERGENDNGIDGLRTISQLMYSIEEKSANQNDNIFTVHNNRIYFINITTFLTYIPFGSEEYYKYDLREPKKKILNPNKAKEITKTVATTNDWTNIPYYPTSRERRENLAKQFISMGKPIPPQLLQKLHEDNKKEIEQDVYNIFPQQKQQIPINRVFQKPIQPTQYHQPTTYPQPNRNYQLPQNQLPQTQPYLNTPFKNNNVKHRATPSARIGLGGAY